MADRLEVCSCCGRFTREGMDARREYYKQHPIYGTDLSRPLSEVIESARNDIVRVRGKLSDVGFAFSGWADRLKSVEGLLTCGLVALYETVREMKEHEAKYPKEATDV